jgi:hypothetical protein
MVMVLPLAAPEALPLKVKVQVEAEDSQPSLLAPKQQREPG